MHVNAYGRQLSDVEIDAKEHRTFVGGYWEELGQLQLSFLQAHGLQPQHTLIDIGCGALRGGIPIVRYLDPDRYYGLDINASLIAAGKRELQEANLTSKSPRLATSDKFELSQFGVRFDYAIAVSLFTHLPMNHIVRCLVEARRVLKPQGVLFATYFDAPAPAFLEPLRHTPGDVVTNYDRDPYHYAFEEFQAMAQRSQLDVQNVGPWNHPRDQRMLAFRAI